MEEVEPKKQESYIMRALYTLLYLVLGRLISVALFIIAITQFIFVLLMDKPNEKIAHFSERLAVYAKELVLYVSFNSDEKPWPVGDWPNN